jgi:two-component system, NtrC family, sensor kinase
MSFLFSRLHMGLRTKFVLVISFLILSTSALLSGYLIHRQNSLIERELEKRAESLVRNLAFNSEYGVLVDNQALLLNLMKGLSQEEDVNYIVIQDRMGKVVADWHRTEADQKLCSEKLKMIQLQFKDTSPRETHFIYRSEEFSNFSYPIKTQRVARSKEELGLPLSDQNGQVKEEMIGMANIGMGLQHMRKEIGDMTKVLIGLTMLVVLVGILLTIFLVNIFIKPVKRLVQATENVAKGDLSHIVEVTAKDEIGTLATSFNQMTISLRESREKIEEYNRTLENKVRERTVELEKTNRDLANALKSLKETQSQLIQVEKMAAVGQLAAGVAHELNNPLGGILGYSQFALEKINQKPLCQFSPEDNNSFMQYLTDIEKQTKKCRTIIQSLLKFSRASSREEFELININQVLRETFVFTQHQIVKNKVHLVQELTEPLPQIAGHPSQLQQVFTNLVLNAVQAMTEGGTLKVASKMSKDSPEIEVSFVDTGIGIAEENLNKVFEPFFTTKKVGEGTGLGLSVSYGLIKDHGGEIRVESRKNQGTTFIVILPIHKTEEATLYGDEKKMVVSVS